MYDLTSSTPSLASIDTSKWFSELKTSTSPNRSLLLSEDHRRMLNTVSDRAEVGDILAVSALRLHIEHFIFA